MSGSSSAGVVFSVGGQWGSCTGGDINPYTPYYPNTYSDSTPCYPNTYSDSTTYCPNTYSDSTTYYPNIKPLPEEKNNIKSKEGETFQHGHKITGHLYIEHDKVFVKFICSECNEILAEKVIFKLPKKVKKAKCLPRLVKQV